MKKIVLLFLMVFGLVAAGFSVTSPESLGYTASPYLELYGYINCSYRGVYLIYYDTSAKSLVIRIQYGQGTPTSLYITENSNPKLFAVVKDTIEKHMNSQNQYKIDGGYSYYGWIRFWYKDTLIVGIDYKNKQNQ